MSAASPEMERRTFAKGEDVFKEGDAGDAAFMVESGRVEIWREMDGMRTVLGEVKPGGLFGEMAMINSKPRMASAAAAEDTVCYVIPVSVFNEKLNQADALMKALLLSFMQHVRNLTKMLEDAKSDDGVQWFQPDQSGEYKRIK